MKIKAKGVFSTAISISIFVIFSKMLGLFKQILLAYKLGANLSTDAYFISSGVIVSICIVLFTAISISVLPVYNDYNKKHNEKAQTFLNSVLFFSILLAIILTILIMVFSTCFAQLLLIITNIFLILIVIILKILIMVFLTSIAQLLSSSPNIDLIEMISKNIRVMSIVLVFSSYYYILNVVLEAKGIFLPGKFYAFLQNLFLIIAIYYFSDFFGLNALIYAFIFAIITQSVIITIKVHKYHQLRFPSSEFFTDIKQVTHLIIPLIIGNGIYQINDIVDKNIASGIGDGYASYLNYG